MINILFDIAIVCGIALVIALTILLVALMAYAVVGIVRATINDEIL